MKKTASPHSHIAMTTFLQDNRFTLNICETSLNVSGLELAQLALDFMGSVNTATKVTVPITISRCSVCQGALISFPRTEYDISESQEWFRPHGLWATRSS